MRPEKTNHEFYFKDERGKSLTIILTTNFKNEGKDTCLQINSIDPGDDNPLSNQRRPVVHDSLTWVGTHHELLAQLIATTTLDDRTVRVSIKNCLSQQSIDFEKQAVVHGPCDLDLPREAYETIVVLLKHTSYMP